MHRALILSIGVPRRPDRRHGLTWSIILDRLTCAVVGIAVTASAEHPNVSRVQNQTRRKAAFPNVVEFDVLDPSATARAFVIPLMIASTRQIAATKGEPAPAARTDLIQPLSVFVLRHGQGGGIRTRGLTAPSRTRCQTAPRPDAP